MSLEYGVLVHTKQVTLKSNKNEIRLNYTAGRKREFFGILLGAAPTDKDVTKYDGLNCLGDVGFIQIDFLYDYLGEKETQKLLEQYKIFIEQFKPSETDETPVAK